MKNYFLVLILVCSFSILFAQSNEELFTDANKHYQSKEYLIAIEMYHSILQKGYISSELYFNLANSYYKLGSLGKSILNYERALKLDSNDEDILFNLSLANSKVVDKIDKLPDSIFTKFWKTFSDMFSYHTWGYLAIIFSFLSMITFFVYYLSKFINHKKMAFYLMLVFFGLTFISAFIKNQQESFIQNYKPAIILADNVYVKSAPNLAAEDYFVLHQGTKVVVIEEVHLWKKIRLQDGKIGWMKSDSLEKI